MIPTRTYQTAIADGWKLLIVDLVVANESPLWGTIQALATYGHAYVTTESGYVYQAASTPMDLSQLPEIPYPTETLYEGQHQGYIAGDGAVAIENPLPPGFAASGTTLGRNPFHLIFQVAESQNSFQLTLDSVYVACILPTGESASEDLGPLTLDLGSDWETITFPTASSYETIPPIPQSFDLAGKGIAQFLGLQRQAWDEHRDLVLLSFNITNSSGYQTEGLLTGYLIGDDGRMLAPGCFNRSGKTDCSENFNDFWFGPGYFNPGPGQTYYTELGFLTWREVHSLVFVWMDAVDRPGAYLGDAPRVYRFFSLPTE